MKIFLLLLVSFPTFAYRLNTSNGSSFGSNTVKFYVTSNSHCPDAGISARELLNIAKEAARKFWNRVPSSALKLESGGIYQTTNDLFTTGILCPEQSGSNCDTSTSIPYVSKLLIACNNESTENFPNDSYIAIGAPTRVKGSRIRGSIILINDTSNSPFAALSYSEKVSVLAHELGHAIGIGHSNNDEALMYFENADKISRLSQDDIDAVSYLYPRDIDNCNGVMATIEKDHGNPFTGHFLFGLGVILALAPLRKLWFYQSVNS